MSEPLSSPHPSGSPTTSVASIWTIREGSAISRVRPDEPMPVEAMRYVPHAEYKALHQDRDTWIHSFQAEQAQSARLAAELDTLRRKVRALLAADDELDAANTMFESVPTDGTGKAIIVAMRQRRSAMMELR